MSMYISLSPRITELQFLYKPTSSAIRRNSSQHPEWSIWIGTSLCSPSIICNVRTFLMLSTDIFHSTRPAVKITSDRRRASPLIIFTLSSSTHDPPDCDQSGVIPAVQKDQCSRSSSDSHISNLSLLERHTKLSTVNDKPSDNIHLDIHTIALLWVVPSLSALCSLW